MKIDYGAHFGGALAGIAIGFLLLIIWPEEEKLPPWRFGAAAAAFFGMALTFFAATEVATHYNFYAARTASLVPLAMMRAHSQELAEQSQVLVERYPHDPLVRLLRGTDFLAHQDFSAAEEQARTGLLEHEILNTETAPTLEDELTMLLTISLWGEGLKDEAHDLVSKACATTPTDPYVAWGRQRLERVGACR